MVTFETAGCQWGWWSCPPLFSLCLPEWPPCLVVVRVVLPRDGEASECFDHEVDERAAAAVDVECDGCGFDDLPLGGDLAEDAGGVVAGDVACCVAQLVVAERVGGADLDAVDGDHFVVLGVQVPWPRRGGERLLLVLAESGRDELGDGDSHRACSIRSRRAASCPSVSSPM